MGAEEKQFNSEVTNTSRISEYLKASSASTVDEDNDGRLTW